jgi:small nuclear ribonucleoprotein (snRNP)-like protein
MTETRHVPPPQVSASEQNNIGMVVIRGNSVVMIEALEKLWGDNN